MLSLTRDNVSLFKVISFNEPSRILQVLGENEIDLRRLLGICDPLQFRELVGGIVRTPVLVLRNGKAPVGVLKYTTKDINYVTNQLEAMDRLYKSGFGHTPQIFRIQGNYLTKIGGTAFSFIEYITPDSIVQPSSLSLRNLLSMTGKFHRFSHNIKMPAYEEETPLGKLFARVQYFESTPVLSCLSEHLQNIDWPLIVRVVQFFVSQSFGELYHQLPKQLIIGDNHRGNIVIREQIPYFIDLDTRRHDARLLDIVALLKFDGTPLDSLIERLDNLLECYNHENPDRPITRFEKDHVLLLTIFLMIESLGWKLQMLEKALNEKNEVVTDRVVERIQNSIHSLAPFLSLLDDSMPLPKCFTGFMKTKGGAI